MNNLPCDIINNILIIKHEEEIKGLKKIIDELQNILIDEDYSPCEWCNKWFCPEDLTQTLDQETICQECELESDYLPCHSCGLIDHCDEMKTELIGDGYIDICKVCDGSG